MNKDCSTCSFGNLTADKNPCFHCVDDPYHRSYQPISYSNDIMARDIETKRAIFNIINHQSFPEGKEKTKQLLQLKKAEEDYTLAVMKAIKSERFFLVEEVNGRLHRV